MSLNEYSWWFPVRGSQLYSLLGGTFLRAQVNLTQYILLGLVLSPLLLGLLVATRAFASPIYVFKEADGTIRFTSQPPPHGVNARVFTASKRNAVSFVRGKYYSPRLVLDRYKEVITSAAQTHDVDPALVRAVIHAESAFNPYAVSRKGAMGLMQLMPETARVLGVKKPFSAEDNIHGGVRYLSKLLQRFQGNLVLAIAAYNAGEGAVERYGGIPPFSETQDYVRKVLALKTRYQNFAAG